MDAALYERAKQLLEERLAEHRRELRLGSLRSMKEANVAEITRREAAMDKGAPRAHSAKSALHSKPPASSGNRLSSLLKIWLSWL